MDTQPDYTALLQQCRRGDPTAREKLFRHLEVRLRTILKYRLRGWSTDDLDDVLQDTLLVVSEKLDQVETHPDFFALNVLRNKIGNCIIRRRRRVFLSLNSTGSTSENEDDNPDQVTAVANPEDDFAVVEDADTAATIKKAIGQLSPLCQALFTALLDSVSVADTWDFFQQTESGLQRATFDKRLFDCRRRLRRLVARSLQV
jgi:DNA-directed RNA polymerase specialized sigma24 family protein